MEYCEDMEELGPHDLVYYTCITVDLKTVVVNVTQEMLLDEEFAIDGDLNLTYPWKNYTLPWALLH